ncbi:hypothetical protein [Kitasatospora phosalacinea]|uniref:hypothetical protein n=1 Tax=Kitasatospora phosalacinea TaxID=2065 RepID=UPI00068B7DCE|nr:hypothetical protein [Kitasatospora phosalacinea]
MSDRLAIEVLPSPRRTAEVRIRVDGEDLVGGTAGPGGCCGHLAGSVRRHGGLVVRSDRGTPGDEPRPPDLHFDVHQCDAELARVTADRWWDVPPAP